MTRESGNLPRRAARKALQGTGVCAGCWSYPRDTIEASFNDPGLRIRPGSFFWWLQDLGKFSGDVLTGAVLAQEDLGFRRI